MIALSATVLALALLGPIASGQVAPGAGSERAGALGRLQRALDAEPRVASRATVTIGRSAQGRPIRAVAVNGQGRGPRVLVVGCVHGSECAGIRVARRIYEGCPPQGDGVVVVPNLNPDGYALGTRLNGRGVDLNRNFGSQWRPIDRRGDPEYSGPRPFSEPEARIARRLIRTLHPEVTIWFHQQARPLVRAWGPSVQAARAYARLAGADFVRLPWMAGTAPNWQNHNFPGTSSFVVELPVGAGTTIDNAGYARAATTLATGSGGDA